MAYKPKRHTRQQKALDSCRGHILEFGHIESLSEAWGEGNVQDY